MTNQKTPVAVARIGAMVVLAIVTLAGAAAARSQTPQEAATPGTAPAPAPLSPMKQAFASTLAAVIQAVGPSVAIGITAGVTGGIARWFEKKAGASASAAAPPAPAPAPSPTAAYAAGAPPATDGGSGAPPDPGSPYSSSTASSTDDGSTYGAAMAPASAAAPAPDADILYAGLAYEVHAMQRDGSSYAIDPMSHVFQTGDRFVVYYRPALPGRITVTNVNPLGVERQIDSTNVAAGQLATLGPYAFTASKGSETLRLQLQPCRNDTLVTMTRDIVRADELESSDYPTAGAGAYGTDSSITTPDSAGAYGQSSSDTVTGADASSVAPTEPALVGDTPALALPDCGNAGTQSRSVRTRDIEKVETDGSTSYALDPIAPQEIQSGNIAPREVTIVFQHS